MKKIIKKYEKKSIKIWKFAKKDIPLCIKITFFNTF